MALLAAALVASSCRSSGPTDVTLTRTPTSVPTAAATTVAPTPTATSTPTPRPTITSVPPTSTPTPAAANAATANALLSASGVVVPVVERLVNGWRVRTPCSNAATVTAGQPLATATVVLDPGHGGHEPGAVSSDKMSEAPVNLAVSLQARAALEAAGVSVVLTRTGDYDVDLATRAEIAKALRPRAFVSVHHNAQPDGPWPGPGSETYYQIASPDSKRLAGLLYEEVQSAFSSYPDVAWVADRDAGTKYRPGSKGDYYAMLRLPGPVVSALSEGAFISNPPEAALLARPDVREAEGAAIARAILRYLNTSDPGSGFTEPYPRVDPPASGDAPPPCIDPPL